MFSSTAEYALRAIVHLAVHREGLCNSQEIAAATRVPPGYISKILKDLVEAGLVTSRRGPNGGFTLSKEPSAMTVLEVVNATDPIERIRTCPLGIPTHGTSLCRLHRKLDNAIALVEQTLASSTISDMIEPTPGAGKCVFPAISAKRRKGPA